MHAFPSLAASREPDTMRRSLDLVSPDQDSMKSAEEWLKAWTDGGKMHAAMWKTEPGGKKARKLFTCKDYKKTILTCRLNPLELMCTCKGFRHHCICSHVLAVSHLLKGIDLKKELQELSKRREAHRPREARGARQI